MAGVVGGEQAQQKTAREVAALTDAVRSEKLGEVAEEFDRVHSIQRALEVGSVDRIIAATSLRPYVVDALERGIDLTVSEATSGTEPPR
jgi:hypothetical protein